MVVYFDYKKKSKRIFFSFEKLLMFYLFKKRWQPLAYKGQVALLSAAIHIHGSIQESIVITPNIIDRDFYR